MSGIRTGIELHDGFSDVIYGIIDAVDAGVSAMQDMTQAMNANVSTEVFNDAVDGAGRAEEAINGVNDALQQMQDNLAAAGTTDGIIPQAAPQPLPDPLVENPEPNRTPIQPRAPDPVTWESDNLEVFTGTGIERFRQEAASANQMLEQLSATQDAIAQQAYNTTIFPPEAFQDLNSMAVRIDMIRDRVQQITNNPVNMGTDEANAELEQLRAQLDSMIQTQGRLNQAVQNMDVAEANAEYMRLSQTVSQTERNIRDNVNAQGAFNSEIQEGSAHADGLMNSIKGMVAAYATIQTVQNVLNISDELTTTTARLDMMNDGVRSTDELVKMVYASAQDARGEFSQMADVVARFGNNAKDAFSSTEEVVAFSNLIQKQMTIAGASTEEANAALLQLSQGLGSGVLRGEELNSVFEQAPNIIQSIADYLEVPIGEIRDMAAEGELTAGVVKAAIFAAADDINAKFESMPMTWGQLWTSFTNTAMIAFQPVLQRLNDMANSEAFQAFVNSAVQALATVANIVLNIFSLIGSVGSFIADNWSVIAPIVYGIVGALAVYYGWLGLVKAASLATAAAEGIAAVAKGIMAAATVVLTGATWAQTTAQMGLNSAMYACPIVWIIMLIIALIAIIYAVCSAIANLTGIANTGFGVITGGINVVIQFFKNLGLTVANIALGIASAVAALGHNIIAAFSNAIANVQTFFYNLLSTAMSVITQIAEALNKLPFVEFDTSGLVAAADSYAAKAAAAQESKMEYEDIGAAFSSGFDTFDAFESGWASEAFNSGASWGDGVMDKISDFSLSDIFGATDIPSVEDYTSGFDNIGGLGSDVGSIADNTGAIADSMDITEEELKYMRDIAEQEAVNRYTTAEISVDMSGMQNNINNNDDIDGFVSKLTDSVNEAVDNMTEGVHK